MELLNNDSLQVFTSGTVRDQWGDFSMSNLSKHDNKVIGKREGPVHGNKDHIREIRAGATCAIT